MGTAELAAFLAALTIIIQVVQSFGARIRNAEAKALKASMGRIHDRMDECLENQVITTHSLNGNNGFHARIAVLEERCKKL